MSAERRAASKRYRIRFIASMSVYALLVVLLLPLVKRIEPMWAKATLALVPVVPIVVAVSEMLRFVASLDELERRVQFEAVSAASILTCLSTFAWGLLEVAGLPHLRAVLVLPLFCLFYGIAVWLTTRKYA